LLLIREAFGSNPTPDQERWFDENLKKAGKTLGATWLEDEPLQNVLTRMQPHVERLKPIKAVQVAAVAKKTP
jgi:hypothetical protein